MTIKIGDRVKLGDAAKMAAICVDRKYAGQVGEVTGIRTVYPRDSGGEPGVVVRMADGETWALGLGDFEPARSQHPADLKPRGVKAPLGLIPWSVVAEDWTPPGVIEAAKALGRYPDGGRYQATVPFGTVTEGDTLADFLLTVILSGRLGEVTIEDVAEAFGYGAAKYEPWNWQSFAWDRAAETEYWGAICRHLRAVEKGEERAEDSGVRHLAHAAAGCMIWSWHASRIADEAGPKVGDVIEVAPDWARKVVTRVTPDAIHYENGTIGRGYPFRVVPAKATEASDPFPVGCRVAWGAHRPPYCGTYEAGTGTVLPGRLAPPGDPDHDTRKVSTGGREVYMRTSDLRRVP